MFANLALCFERYRVTGIRIRYRPGSNFVDLVGNGANVYFAPTVGSGQMFVAHMPNDFNGDSWLLNPGRIIGRLTQIAKLCLIISRLIFIIKWQKMWL